jgi:hypothetical protein
LIYFTRSDLVGEDPIVAYVIEPPTPGSKSVQAADIRLFGKFKFGINCPVQQPLPELTEKVIKPLELI